MRKDLDDKGIIKLYESGLSLTQIAPKLKCNRATIWNRLKKNNITCRQGRGKWGRGTSIMESLSKEKLQQLVDKHSSMRKLMEEINIGSYSYWYRLVKQRLIQDGIDVSGFGRGLISEIMVENSKFKRPALRGCVVRNNLLDRNQCSICGLNAVWQGSPLVLILDHIDGTPNDHRLENLRYVCPNCNSQLPTFAGRNSKLRRKQV